MSRYRFVVPETVRLFLSDGDWIDVKKSLNVGEQKRLEATGVTRTIAAPPSVNWAEYTIGRVCVWLEDWSFKDTDGKDVPLSVDAVRALDTATFTEIQVALTKHVQGIEDSKNVKPSMLTASVSDGAESKVT